MATSTCFQEQQAYDGLLSSIFLTAPSGTDLRTVSIAENHTNGIIQFANQSGQTIYNGGIYFFTTREEDAVGRSTRYLGSTISASGSGGASYTFYYSRPEIFNVGVDAQAGTNSYGTIATPVILIDQLYIDTATWEVNIRFATSASTGSYSASIYYNMITFNGKEDYSDLGGGVPAEAAAPPPNNPVIPGGEVVPIGGLKGLKL